MPKAEDVIEEAAKTGRWFFQHGLASKKAVKKQDIKILENTTECF